jgi:hypothetical protein
VARGERLRPPECPAGETPALPKTVLRSKGLGVVSVASRVESRPVCRGRSSAFGLYGKVTRTRSVMGHGRPTVPGGSRAGAARRLPPRSREATTGELQPP